MEPLFKVGDIIVTKKDNKTQDFCHQEWNKLRQEILDKIDKIDRDTPWTETEPKWWLDMQDIRRHISNSKAIIK